MYLSKLHLHNWRTYADATFEFAEPTARKNVEGGLALPGIDAADDYNDYAFALPANATYLSKKRPFADQRMGEAIKIWEAN